jgi:hypothetical protein
VPEAWGALGSLAGLRLAGNAALCGPLPQVLLNGPIAHLAAGSGGGASNGTGAGFSPGTSTESAALAAAINGTALLRECVWARTGKYWLTKL